MSRPKIDRTGEVGVNNDGERMTIIRCGGRNDIDVQFQDGTVVEHNQYNNFKNGEIKNPMFPSVFGVGYFGIGDYKSMDENGKNTKCYNTWVHMLMRCYDPKYHEKKPTYKSCTVDEQWHNFQNFAQWYYSNYYEFEDEKLALDKDILHKSNKMYSPETCVFLPVSINSLFTKSNNTRGKFPIGVYKNRNKFQAKLSKDNRKIHLGLFNTPEEAFQAYKIAKEEYIKQIAEKYKSQIPYELYQAMMNYEVEIDD